MKFNPITKELYTDKDDFIKSLHCPLKISWELLDPHNSYSKKCSYCERSIIDTQLFSDEDIHEIVNLNPNTCLKIDLNQNNIKLL